MDKNLIQYLPNWEERQAMTAQHLDICALLKMSLFFGSVNDKMKWRGLILSEDESCDIDYCFLKLTKLFKSP